jgi:hypothetical protein
LTKLRIISSSFKSCPSFLSFFSVLMYRAMRLLSVEKFALNPSTDFSRAVILFRPLDQVTKFVTSDMTSSATNDQNSYSVVSLTHVQNELRPYGLFSGRMDVRPPGFEPEF